MTSAKEVVGSHVCVEVKIKCCDVLVGMCGN
jgi:hypothetical protein